MTDYYQALDSFKEHYSNTFGIARIEEDNFGVNDIVVLVDDLRYKTIDVPKSYMGYEVHTVGIYALLKAYESIVHTYVVHDPSFWEEGSEIPFQYSLSKIEDVVLDYEEKVEKSINSSLLRIKRTMEWIIIHNPPPKRTKRA